MQIESIEDLMTPRDVERCKRIDRRTLQRYRQVGAGPKHVIRFGIILYQRRQVEAWMKCELQQ